jgi:hypothetical protein
MRSGILIAVVGAWLVLRTVRKDASGRNLVDRITGATSDTSDTSATSDAPPVAPARTPSVSPGVGPPAPAPQPQPSLGPAGHVTTVQPVGPLKPVAGPAGVIG